MKKYLILTVLFAVSINAQPVPPDAVVELLYTGFLQPEGPVWIDGSGIIFSDIMANRIYLWSPTDSSLSTYLNPSDSSNGLTLDLQGRLILTQMAKRRVARREPNGDITPLAVTYKGRKFNSPNDVVVKSDGSIFFTDPDFNTPAGQTKEMGFKGIFRISPYGEVYALDSTTFGTYAANSEPNGICFSPDESKIYINDSPIGRIYVWDVADDTTIVNRTTLYTIPLGGYADGMKVDPDGNIYCTGPRGVWVVSPSGVCLDTILLPSNKSASNCNWGDADRKTLYITEGGTNNRSLFRIRLSSGSDAKDYGYLPRKSFKLENNYPNPFNPSTTISFEIPAAGYTTMKIYNSLGREVSTLVNGIKEAGRYSILYNSGDLASGVYFYRLSSGFFSETKSMILLK
jgi:gluconolactonase